MRITNSILAKEALSGFQAQMRALDDARREASTGIRVSRPSDDPVAVAGVMRSASGLRALEQYQRNLTTAHSRLDAEDSALTQLTDALSRAKELALSQAGSSGTASTRAMVAKEMRGLANFATSLANTQVAGSYLFGGQYSDTPPFMNGALDPAKPPSGTFKVEVGTRQFLDTNHSAQEVFVDSGVVDSLTALATALETDDSAGILAGLDQLDGAFEGVQNLIGDLGARMSQLDVAVSNLSSLEVNLQTFRSSLEDADLTEAVTRLVSMQGAMEGAMLANSKILNLTLTDYLR